MAAVLGLAAPGAMADGTRKIVSLSEIVGMEGEVVTMQDLFVYEREGIDEDGNVVCRGVQGPDFPRGGRILGRKGILDAYSTGRGRVLASARSRAPGA